MGSGSSPSRTLTAISSASAALSSGIQTETLPDYRCSKEMTMGVLDDYMVDPKLSLLDKTRIQAQVLVPVMRALRAELGRDKADTIVREALRDWSKQLFAAISEGLEGSP